MVELIEMAAEFLKINPMLVSEYMQEGTIQGIFYLFFFPSVFLFLFVMTLMNAKGPSRNDLKLLVTVSIYAFIIMSGYYTWFVWLSRWWLYLMIILGVWYMIMSHKSSGEIDKVGGGDAGGQPRQSPGYGKKGSTYGQVRDLMSGDPLGLKGEIRQLKMDMMTASTHPEGSNELNKSITARMSQLRSAIHNDPRGAVYKKEFSDLEKLKNDLNLENRKN